MTPTNCTAILIIILKKKQLGTRLGAGVTFLLCRLPYCLYNIYLCVCVCACLFTALKKGLGYIFTMAPTHATESTWQTLGTVSFARADTKETPSFVCSSLMLSEALFTVQSDGRRSSYQPTTSHTSSEMSTRMIIAS